MIPMKRLALSEPAKAVRRKIELLDQRIDLPIARKALGLLEGEHPSHRRFGTGDVIDVHAWQPGDEARMMNWSASARTGQPMVSSRERTSSSLSIPRSFPVRAITKKQRDRKDEATSANEAEFHSFLQVGSSSYQIVRKR